MLISPPFLPPRDANQTDAEWIATAMGGLAAGSVPRRGERPIVGNYPVSLEMGWHGGIHLQAPNDNQGRALPVRAIADGRVIFTKPVTPQNTNHDHALNYGATPGSTCWTSDGVVLIRHDTEIGSQLRTQGGNQTEVAVSVTYYSLYVHLSSVDLTLGQRVYRKDQVGQAGYIYGQPNRIHFEIFCDDANLEKLIGRISGELPVDRDGRSDVVFGELYFYLPAGTPIYPPGEAQRPLLNNPEARHRPHPPGLGAQQPPETLLNPIHTTTEPLIIGLHYAQGDDPNGRGNATLTTYHPNGTPEGDTIVERNAEYNLYRDANAIASAYTTTPRPARSAVYELLRFGRVINTSQETLNPENVPHWRQIRYPGGTGWVNLNAANVRKFSDGDFPHWKHWKLIDDSADRDSRCDSPTILGWLDTDADTLVGAAEARAGMQDANIVKKLEHAICKFPTEWEKATIETRWNWLKTHTPENPEPLSTADFELFKAHAEALCFWKDIPAQIPALPSDPWRFQPQLFVKVFRKCQWLDDSELGKIYPAATANNIRSYRIALNRSASKYLITNKLRLAHFYGQAAVESAQLRLMSELYNGDPYNYFRNYAKAKNFAGWLGNVEWNDGGTFRGRGFKQLTGRANYSNYWVYRGWLAAESFSDNWWRNSHWWGIEQAVQASQYNTLPIQNATTVSNLINEMRPPIIDNANIVSENNFNCIDTAGWFWAKNTLILIADRDDIAAMTRSVRGDGAAIGDTQPWPAAAHFPDRQAHTRRICQLLGDTP